MTEIHIFVEESLCTLFNEAKSDFMSLWWVDEDCICEECVKRALLISTAFEIIDTLESVVMWYGKRDKDEQLLPASQQEKEIERAMNLLAKVKGQSNE